MTHILIGGRPIGANVQSGFGHLFLVLSEDLVLSDEDLVIRAGPDGHSAWSTLQGQVNVELNFTNDSFINVGNLLGVTDDEARGFYATAEIQIPNYDAAAIWTTLSSVAS